MNATEHSTSDSEAGTEYFPRKAENSFPSVEEAIAVFQAIEHKLSHFGKSGYKLHRAGIPKFFNHPDMDPRGRRARSCKEASSLMEA